MQWLFFRRLCQINFYWPGSSPDVVTLYFWRLWLFGKRLMLVLITKSERETAMVVSGAAWLQAWGGLGHVVPPPLGVGGSQAVPVALSLSRLPLLQRCFSPGPAPALCFLMTKTGDISLLLHSHPYSDQKCVPVWTETNSEMNMLIRAGLFSLVFSNPVAMQ